MKRRVENNLFLKVTAVAVVAVLAIFGTACRKSGAGSELTRQSTGEWQRTVHPEATAVTTNPSATTWYLMYPDGKSVGGMPLNGYPSAMYNGLFAARSMTRDQYNVYSADKPVTPLNTTPFEAISDFRTGFAYGTRRDTPLLVVNRNGAVVRELDEDIRRVILFDGVADCAAYEKSDKSMGLIRPNGDKIVERAPGEIVYPLFSDRFIVQTSAPVGYAVYDGTSRAIFTLAPGTKPSTNRYYDGWLGVENTSGVSYFVDKNGNTALRIPERYRPCERYGNVALIQNREDKSFAIINADDGHFILDNILSYHFFTNDGAPRFLIRPGGSPDLVEVDEMGRKVESMTWPTAGVGKVTDRMLFMRSGQGSYAAYDLLTGRPVSFMSGRFYLPAANNLPDYSVVESSLNVYSRIEGSLIDGLNPSGWKVGDFLFSGSQTAEQLLSPDMTAEQTFELFNRGKRSVSLSADQQTFNLVFDVMPATFSRVTETETFGIFKFQKEHDRYLWNPESHLKAVFVFVENGRGTTAGLMSAVRKMLSAKGFVGYSDEPSKMSNGSTYAYMIPTDSGIYLVVSFGSLDYRRITDTDFTLPAVQDTLPTVTPDNQFNEISN